MDPEKIAAAIAASVQARVEKAIAPLLARLDALEAKEMPDLAGELLASDRLKTLIDLQVTEAVAEIVPEPGKDGEKGEPGADGVGLAGFVVNEAGELVATNTKGEAFNLGRIRGYDGKDGEKGADGLGFEDMSVRFNEDSTFTLMYQRGDQVKEFTSPQLGVRHKGYWRDGHKAVAGDLWVHAGTCWVAKCETQATPSRVSEDWEIFASKGRDGERGPAGKDYKPAEPIKVSHG